MLRATLGKVVHTVKRAGAYAAKVPPQELYKIAVREGAVVRVHHLMGINNKNARRRYPPVLYTVF
jgi:hypothetical protein